MELSVIIPCLNEAETLGTCIAKAKKQIQKLNIKAEIVISDNGSTDKSVEIAEKLGARVIHSNIRGYGSAVINGIKNAKGKYILIADADDSYNLDDIPTFFYKIKEGYDLIQGCRMPSGGGKIQKGAMPITHRLIGNPLFTFLSKKFFGLKFNDVYCGMKILKKSFFQNTNFFSKGMVFCLEILIKSKTLNGITTEVPITLYRDGRVKSKSHLRTISDGLKTFKFILVCCPKWLYFFPSFLFILFCPIFYFFSNKFITLADDQKILVSLLLFFLSFQFFMLGLFASLRAKILQLYNGDWIKKFFDIFNLKIALSISMLIFLFSILSFYLNLSFLSHQENFILLNFLIFFSLSFAANSLVISLLSLDN